MKGDLLSSGHSACAGCGEVLGVQQVLRVLGKNTVVCMATGCMEITTSAWPQTAWRIPWLHVAFENAAAAASGVAEALKQQGKSDVNVVAMGGDGGMYDIGLQAMSGALERGHNMIIICTDNEAYMNTGIQRSGSTPKYAATTTSPAGKVIHGKAQWKKNITMIAAAHNIPLAATTNIAFPQDLEAKLKKAQSLHGAKFINHTVNCTVGWGFDSSRTIEIAKLAVETGIAPLYEIEHGKLRITYKPEQLKHVKEYFAGQKRYAHLTEAEVEEIDKRVKADWAALLAREACDQKGAK